MAPNTNGLRGRGDYVLPHAEIRYIRGRLRFNGIGNSAPFPSVLAIFPARREGGSCMPPAPV